MKVGFPDNFKGIPTFNVNPQDVQNINAPIEMQNDLYKNKKFQWMGGPNLGLVTKVGRTIVQNNQTYIILEDGKQLDLETFKKMLQPLEDNIDCDISRPITPPLPEDVKNYINSLKTPENMPLGSTTVTTNNTQLIKQPPIQNQQIQLLDPVINILSKKKQNIESIACTLNIDLPKISLFDMLVDDFDKTSSDVLDLILNKKNIDSIKSQLKPILLQFYNRKEVINEIKDKIKDESDNII